MPQRLVPIARTDEMGFIRPPVPGDILAPTLRAAFGEQPDLPADLLRLLQSIDRPTRQH